MVMGDLNLNFLKWNNPDFHQQYMAELVQNHIETLGFTQLISSWTRSWKDQEDSLPRPHLD